MADQKFYTCSVARIGVESLHIYVNLQSYFLKRGGGGQNSSKQGSIQYHGPQERSRGAGD